MRFDEEDEVLFDFCDAYREGKQFDQKKLYDALCSLGYGKKKLDESHNQTVACARKGCAHPYYRHFDSFEGNREVGCKYCQCSAFVEADDGK